MRREERLAKRDDFKKVYNEGRSIADRYLVLYWLPRPIPGVQLGISVSRRVAGSVGRNRLKRWVREAWRAKREHVKPGFHLVVIVRVAARHTHYAQIASSLQCLLQRAGLWCHVGE